MFFNQIYICLSIILLKLLREVLRFQMYQIRLEYLINLYQKIQLTSIIIIIQGDINKQNIPVHKDINLQQRAYELDQLSINQLLARDDLITKPKNNQFDSGIKSNFIRRSHSSQLQKISNLLLFQSQFKILKGPPKQKQVYRSRSCMTLESGLQNNNQKQNQISKQLNSQMQRESDKNLLKLQTIQQYSADQRKRAMSTSQTQIAKASKRLLHSLEGNDPDANLSPELTLCHQDKQRRYRSHSIPDSYQPQQKTFKYHGTREEVSRNKKITQTKEQNNQKFLQVSSGDKRNQRDDDNSSPVEVEPNQISSLSKGFDQLSPQKTQRSLQQSDDQYYHLNSPSPQNELELKDMKHLNRQQPEYGQINQMGIEEAKQIDYGLYRQGPEPGSQQIFVPYYDNKVQNVKPGFFDQKLQNKSSYQQDVMHAHSYASLSPQHQEESLNLGNDQQPQIPSPSSTVSYEEKRKQLIASIHDMMEKMMRIEKEKIGLLDKSMPKNKKQALSMHQSGPKLTNKDKKKIIQDKLKNLADFITLEIVKDMAYECVLDKRCCRLIQDRLKLPIPKEERILFYNKILNDEKVDFDLLANHENGNYVYSIILQNCDDPDLVSYKNSIFERIRGRILDMSSHKYSCRVVQSTFEVMDLGRREQIISEIIGSGKIHESVQNYYVNHVFQRIIIVMGDCKGSLVYNNFILEFQSRVLQYSTDEFGCRVIQKIIENAAPEVSQVIRTQIIQNFDMFIYQLYGVFVLTSVLQNGSDQEKEQLLFQVSLRVLQMSVNVNGSKFLENSIKLLDSPDKITSYNMALLLLQIVNSIVYIPAIGPIDQSHQVGQPGFVNFNMIYFRDILFSEYGNYVIQRTWEKCDPQRQFIIAQKVQYILTIEKQAGREINPMAMHVVKFLNNKGTIIQT